MDSTLREMAEGVGFEPTRRLPAYTRSRRAPSTTRPPLRLERSGAHYNRISLLRNRACGKVCGLSFGGDRLDAKLSLGLGSSR